MPRTPTCHGCSENHSVEDMREAPDGNRYCEPCYEARTTTCYDCDEEMMTVASLYDENSDSHYCSDCFPGARIRFLNAKSYRQNPSERFVGLELEYIQRNDEPKTGTYGRFKGDGSLRASSIGGDGREFVTNPTNGDRLMSMIDKIALKFDEAKAYVNKSCGLHVHLDMRQTTEKEQINVYNAFRSMEKIFFGMVSKSRRENQYCRWLKDRPYHEALRGERYYSLNVCAYPKFQTFEIRMHQGSMNAHKIKNWVLLLLNFFDTFTKTDFPKEKVDEVMSMSDRDKLIFLFQQVKIPLKLRKYMVRRLWKFSGKDSFFVFEKKDTMSLELEEKINALSAQLKILSVEHSQAATVDLKMEIATKYRNLEKEKDGLTRTKKQNKQLPLMERVKMRRQRKVEEMPSEERSRLRRHAMTFSLNHADLQLLIRNIEGNGDCEWRFSDGSEQYYEREHLDELRVRLQELDPANIAPAPRRSRGGRSALSRAMAGINPEEFQGLRGYSTEAVLGGQSGTFIADSSMDAISYAAPPTYTYQAGSGGEVQYQIQYNSDGTITSVPVPEEETSF